jgi:hypothetical protein
MRGPGGFLLSLQTDGYRGRSGPSQLKQRVEVLEFDAGIFGCELPIGLGVVEVAVALPGGDFIGEDLLFGDAAVEALRGETPSSAWA